VATQDPALRAKFSGRAEHVVNFFRFIAEEVREYMAALGFRTIDEMVGRADLLDVRPAVDHWKARGLDLAAVLDASHLRIASGTAKAVPSSVGSAVPSSVGEAVPSSLGGAVPSTLGASVPSTVGASGEPGVTLRRTTIQAVSLDGVLDRQLIELAGPALARRERVAASLAIQNTHRTVGTMLGSEVTRAYGAAGLPDDTIDLRFTGSAGQSFGAFLPRGITLRLEGDANDYVGKGLSGGRLILSPPREATFAAERNIVAGNVCLYGATSGEAFIRGVVGERFAVRNSGAVAVVEGVGDHGCEYMTGGRVIVLGTTGRNFGAGMSGGVAYVNDPDGDFAQRCNHEMVLLERLDDEDAVAVSELVARHRDLTGSTLAARLLEHWGTSRTRFVRVMPVEYKKVLDQQRDTALRVAV
jgi:glutamate synthase (NADPH/NADH) large chain